MSQEKSPELAFRLVETFVFTTVDGQALLIHLKPFRQAKYNKVYILCQK